MDPLNITITITALLLVLLILLQQKSSSLGSMAGQDAGDEIVQTRRGAEKFLHRATIVMALLFVGSSLYAMIA